MSDGFARWSNAAARLTWLAIGLTIVGPPLALMLWVRTPYVTGANVQVEQPIPFDHRHHVVDDGIDCLYCHTDAERGPYAGVPPTDTCLNCHSQVWQHSPLLAPVWRSHDTGQPIRWRRVTFVPNFVYFDHHVHVRKGIGCESCHGRVDQMARVYQVMPMTMAWCVDCHRAPEAQVRPREDVTRMGYVSGAPQAEIGRALVAGYHIEPGTTCSTCHR